MLNYRAYNYFSHNIKYINMSKLNNFRANAINRSKSAKVKGGVFCEWYINQRGEKVKKNENAGILMERVDSVMIANGNKKFA